MAETLQNNPGHSGESIETIPGSGDSPATGKVWLSPKRALKAQMAPLLELLRTPGYPRWLIAAGATLVLMVIVTLAERVSERCTGAAIRRSGLERHASTIDRTMRPTDRRCDKGSVSALHPNDKLSA